MKKILKNTLKTQKYLDKLPKIYLIACWARYGILEFPFTGKYIKENGIDIPLVYDYDDHNGVCDNYYLRKITNTTTGFIVCWLQDKYRAFNIEQALNNDRNKILKEEYIIK